ncbi:MAG: NUDIX hydrolase [Candidatus Eisenbacteria bacterium]|uniref:NUDIX hydrolase n=1 Tax=Eiseniibacteriota bacterium TaxID=2212470 RepID=A0A956SCB1_UNCEI|nr:NUDIX hydrolase [Candidatus Eisenbacteria bacterium]MCB9462989.1 NUDIX hydrolase [Candidatus Eisenbacteria bacterium]
MPRRSSNKLFHPPELIGIEDAESSLGTPLRRNARLVPSRSQGGVYTYGLNRAAEIVMVLPRAGGVLLHTKRFYPNGIYRLPTGGVNDEEHILDAARREVREETGLQLEPTRFLFHLRYPGRPGAPRRGFHSFGFLYPESDGPIEPEDTGEEIDDWRVVSWANLPETIFGLENLESGWIGWGQFRALAHSFLLECRGAHPNWFRPPRSDDRAPAR